MKIQMHAIKLQMNIINSDRINKSNFTRVHHVFKGKKTSKHRKYMTIKIGYDNGRLL